MTEVTPNERPRTLDYKVIVVGLGAVYEEKIKKALDILGNEKDRVLFDSVRSRVEQVTDGPTFIADANQAPLRVNSLPTNERQKYVGFIATPDHLGAIESLYQSGIKKLIVEKPLVNNSQEVKKLEEFKGNNPDLKIYPLDFYVQKVAPLYVLSGALSPEDPRWNWVETVEGSIVNPATYNSLGRLIGDLEAVSVTIFEGGSFGLPDLVKRTWLTEDKQRGGMLLDLGTHALAPLFPSKILKRDDISVDLAHRYVFTESKKGFRNAKSNEVETRAEALMTINSSGQKIPFEMLVGKTYQDGGEWTLNLRGNNGSVRMGLRTGDCLVATAKNANPIGLRIKPGSDPYALAFQEAHMYFENYPGFDGNTRAMLDSIDVIDEIKRVSNN